MAYIGFFPEQPGFSAVNFKASTVTKATTTASGRSIRASNSTTLWQGTLAFPVMSQEEFRPIQAFVASCQGPLNEFDIVVPTVSTSQSPAASTATVAVNGNHSAGDFTIDVTTNKFSTTVLKAGDIIRFANHTKVYMVTSDATTSVAGDVNLSIVPALVESLSDSESVTVNNTPIRMILSNDTQEFNYRTDNLVAYEIDVEEVL